MRRAFKLPEEDEAFLDGRGLDWEAITEGEVRWILISEFDVPNGYNHQKVSVALRIQPSYPDVQIDMAYFHPHLARSDSKGIKALTPFQIDGKSWQQWSRHRVEADAWRPGIDDLQKHLQFVTAFLEEELTKL